MIDRIGSILLRKTTLSEEDLLAALKIQEKSGERVGEILVKQKRIKERDLLKAFSEQFRMDIVPTLPLEIATDFTKIIPRGGSGFPMFWKTFPKSFSISVP